MKNAKKDSKFDVDGAIKLLNAAADAAPVSNQGTRAAVAIGLAIMIAGSTVAQAIRDGKKEERK